jgi:hypothetical protein
VREECKLIKLLVWQIKVFAGRFPFDFHNIVCDGLP